MLLKLSVFINLWEKVSSTRILQGLSQGELAYMSNVHRTYIGMFERTEKNIT